MNKVLYLDFEGTNSKGIREIGFLIAEDGRITSAVEEKGDKAIDYLSKLQKIKYNYIVSHNYYVEKNLIKKYFPYRIDPKTKRPQEHKWLDSLLVYRTLYPNLKKYDLKYLLETFLDPRVLVEETSKRCGKKSTTFHHPLFDATCTYLLILRLASKISFDRFLR